MSELRSLEFCSFDEFVELFTDELELPEELEEELLFLLGIEKSDGADVLPPSRSLNFVLSFGL